MGDAPARCNADARVWAFHRVKGMGCRLGFKLTHYLWMRARPLGGITFT